MKVKMQIQEEKTALTVFAELQILKWLQRADRTQTPELVLSASVDSGEKYDC